MMALSIIAIVLSVGAIVISYFSFRDSNQHNKLSFRPMLSLMFYHNERDGSFRIVLNNHGSIGESNARTYLWLGDASLEAWTLQPMNLAVNHLPVLLIGMDNFEVTVTGQSGALENARVCITNEDLSL